MVEVFRTNVTEQGQAQLLVEQIQRSFAGYRVNFDLHDCDNILRVECKTGFIQASSLINFLKFFGFEAEVLPDECYAYKQAPVRYLESYPAK